MKMTNETETTASKTVLVRAYDAKVIAPDDLDRIILPILAAQNSLWNELVQVEHAIRGKNQEALEKACPEISVIKEKINSLQAASTGNEQALGQIAALRHAIKIETGNARRLASEQLKKIEEERKELVKQAARNAPLWWCHSESVTAKYEKARIKAFKEGRSLRFHRFSEQGSIRLRLGHGGFPIADIYARRTTMLHIEDPAPHELGRRLLTKEDGGRRAALTVRVGAKQGALIPTARLLITIQKGHEPPGHLPLKMVSLRRDLTLSRVQWKVSLTFSGLETPNEEPEKKLPEMFAEIGVLNADDAKIRGLTVAVISSQCTSAHPVVLSAEWLARMSKAQMLLSELDREAAEAWAEISPQCIYQRDAAEWFKVQAKKILGSRVPKHRGLIAFAQAHFRAGQPFGSSVDEAMQCLAEKITRKGQPIYDMRKRALEHRNSFYKNSAAAIAKSASTLRIVNYQERSIAHFKQLEGRERIDYRDLMQHAAVSTLKKYIEQACVREGVQLRK